MSHVVMMLHCLQYQHLLVFIIMSFNHIHYTYRITSVLKVERDIITSVAVNPIGRVVIVYIETFKADVSVFISNVIMCVTSH
jgi:hypothetical protein